MIEYFDFIATLPMSLQFFIVIGMIVTGLIALYLIVWVYNITHPGPPECPDWADPEKWAEFLAYDQALKKRKWWE